MCPFLAVGIGSADTKVCHARAQFRVREFERSVNSQGVFGCRGEPRDQQLYGQRIRNR